MTLDHFYHHEIFQVGIVILAAIGVQAYSRNAIERLVRRAVRNGQFDNEIDEKKREDTVISLLHTSFSLIVWTLAFFFILGLLKVNVAGLLTGAGLFGVIFGFGAQSTIKNYLSGIYVLTENQYRVGDVITLSGGVVGSVPVSGVVEDITLRITKLRALDGSLHTINNGDAAVITNRTFKYANVAVDITVSYDSDIDQVEQVINQVGKQMLEDDTLNKQIITPISFLRVDNFNESGVIVKVFGKVKPATQWDVAGAFRRRIKDAFDKQGIAMGVPEQRQSTKPARHHK